MFASLGALPMLFERDLCSSGTSRVLLPSCLWHLQSSYQRSWAVYGIMMEYALLSRMQAPETNVTHDGTDSRTANWVVFRNLSYKRNPVIWYSAYVSPGKLQYFPQQQPVCIYICIHIYIYTYIYMYMDSYIYAGV